MAREVIYRESRDAGSLGMALNLGDSPYRSVCVRVGKVKIK